jgi:thioredoxin 1
MKNNILTALALCVCFTAGTGCAQDKEKGGGLPPGDSSQTIANRVTESKIPVVIDFWAAWCGPCRYLDPIIEELEDEYKGKVLFLKVNVDTQIAITQYFRVSSIPTVFIVEDKTVRAAFPGVRDKRTYTKAIEDALKLARERGKN